MLLVMYVLCLPPSMAQVREYSFKNTSGFTANDFHFQTDGFNIKNASATLGGAQCFPGRPPNNPPSTTFEWSTGENMIPIPNGATMKLKVRTGNGHGSMILKGYFTQNGVKIGNDIGKKLAVSLHQFNENEGYINFHNTDTIDVQLNNVLVHIDNTSDPLETEPYQPDGVQWMDIPSNFLLAADDEVNFLYTNSLPDGYVAIAYTSFAVNNPEDISEEKVVFAPLDCGLEFLQLNENPIENGTYRAQNISSEGVIPNGATVDYIAGQNITLHRGFRVEQQADFAAEIEDCSVTDNQ